MNDSKLISILFEVRLRLTKEMILLDPKDIETMKDFLYLIAIGCLMHTITYYRPNIPFDVGQVTKFKSMIKTIKKLSCLSRIFI